MAVGVTLLSGPSGGLGYIGSLLRALRLPLVLVNALAENAINASRTAAFVSGLVFAGSLAIVLLALLTRVLPASVETIGSLVFVVFVAITLRRHSRLVVIWLAFCAIVAGVAIWRT